MHTMSVLLATDGSPEALSAAEWLDRWAVPDHVDITVATVIVPPSMTWATGSAGLTVDGDIYARTYKEIIEEERTVAAQALAATRAQLAHCPPVKEEMLTGAPAKVLVEYAKSHHIDLVVMGRRGHSALGNLMGSVSFGVLQRSPVPVTIVS
jgi:nucleotide-binding universal stress UspA family protein